MFKDPHHIKFYHCNLDWKFWMRKCVITFLVEFHGVAEDDSAWFFFSHSESSVLKESQGSQALMVVFFALIFWHISHVNFSLWKRSHQAGNGRCGSVHEGSGQTSDRECEFTGGSHQLEGWHQGGEGNAGHPLRSPSSQDPAPSETNLLLGCLDGLWSPAWRASRFGIGKLYMAC